MFSLRVLIIRCRTEWKGIEEVMKCMVRAGQMRGETIFPTWLPLNCEFKGKVRRRGEDWERKWEGLGTEEEPKAKKGERNKRRFRAWRSCWSAKIWQMQLQLQLQLQLQKCGGLLCVGAGRSDSGIVCQLWHCLPLDRLTWRFSIEARRRGEDLNWNGEQLGWEEELGAAGRGGGAWWIVAHIEVQRIEWKIMMWIRNGCQSLEERQRHCWPLVELGKWISRKGLRQTKEQSQSLMDLSAKWNAICFLKNAFWERKIKVVQQSLRQIGAEWGSCKERCWQCLEHRGEECCPIYGGSVACTK